MALTEKEKEYNRKFRKKHPEYVKKETTRRIAIALKAKRALVAYKGGQCARCGYNKSLKALDFHHLDRKEKRFRLADASRHKLLEELKREVDKCVLLCANCHREISY